MKICYICGQALTGSPITIENRQYRLIPKSHPLSIQILRSPVSVLKLIKCLKNKIIQNILQFWPGPTPPSYNIFLIIFFYLADIKHVNFFVKNKPACRYRSNSKPGPVPTKIRNWRQSLLEVRPSTAFMKPSRHVNKWTI